MRTSLQRIGNSQGVIIPKPFLTEAGLSGEVDMSVERGSIVIRKPQPPARAGWAEDSKRIADAEEALVWPEFGNAGDSDLVW